VVGVGVWTVVVEFVFGELFHLFPVKADGYDGVVGFVVEG